MFRVLCLSAMLCCVLASPHAFAVGDLCGPNHSSHIAIDPANPGSTQQFVITVGIQAFDVSTMSLQMRGNDIDVTLAGTYNGFEPEPPASCLSQVVGPLATGRYTVNLQEVESSESRPPVTVASMSFVVGEIPTVSCSPDSGYITVAPSSPDDTQVVTLTVGRTQAIDPESVIVERVGNSITATLTANVNDFSVALPDFCPAIEIGALPIGTYTVDLAFVDTTRTQPQAVHVKSASFTVIAHPPSPPGPLTGLWWNSSEPGWGIDFVQRRDIVFSAWFTYDSSGRPKWYVAPNCGLATGTSQDCTGDLYQVKGPIVLGGVFNPSAVVATKVGTLTLGFADSNTGSMAYTLGGQTRTVPITREPLRTGPPPTVDYTDLWWNPAESGWGMTITQQSSVMFLALYVFDGGGDPVWYVAPDCEVNDAGDVCTGILYRTTGPPLGATFDASRVQAFAVGNASVTFSDPNNGTLSYTVNGASVTKAITRQFF